MKVCVDIQPAVSQRAGIGRYVAELAKHIPRNGGVDLDLFYFDFKGKAEPPDAPGCSLNRFAKLPGALIQQSWKYLGWPNFDSLAGPADLYHFTNFIIPPLSRNCKAVASIHDISFILHPEFAEKKNLAYLSKRIRATAERAEAIITISKQSAADISSKLNVETGRVHPIYLGVSDRFAPASKTQIDSTRKSLGLTKPYILMVGTFEPRKNIPFAVELLENMDFFDGDLIVVGQKGWRNRSIFEVIESSTASERIRTFTGLPDAHLVNLYSGAEMLLMTSLYEGFGFPPIEAMACGTPVLTSCGGSLAEVCDDAAIVMEDFARDRWIEGARKILSDSVLRSDLIAKGRARAANFTWERTAREHLECYMKVLK